MYKKIYRYLVVEYHVIHAVELYDLHTIIYHNNCGKCVLCVVVLYLIKGGML